MKLYPKLLLVTLCVTLANGCFAGGNTSKESVAKKDDEKFCNVYSSAALTSASRSSQVESKERKFVYEARLVASAPGGLLRAPDSVGSSLSRHDPDGIEITLSAKEIAGLRLQFDDKLVVPDGSRKLIRFDYEHIFNTSNIGGLHVGHYDRYGKFSKAQKDASTVFPQGWAPAKIMSQISKAYEHRAHDNNGKREGNAWVVVVENLQHLKIKLVFELNSEGRCTGLVKTVYPDSKKA